MKKQFIFLFFSFIFTISLSAQIGKFISLNLGTGYHSLSSSVKDGTTSGGLGLVLDAKYSHYFNEKWAFATGLGVKYFHSTTTLNGMNSFSTMDTEGDSFDYRTYFTDYKESQTAFLITIPIGAQYIKPIKEDYKLLAGLGFEIGIPIYHAYKTESGQLETRGYYPEWNVELFGMPQHGFKTVSDIQKGNTSSIPTLAIYGEVGGLYELTRKSNLYFGTYFSYSLSSLVEKYDEALYTQTGEYHGVFASNLTDNVNPFTIGVKLGLQWTMGKVKYLK
jgi:hypothetical protein